MTQDEMDWEFECAQRLAGCPSDNAGMLVTTKGGLIGRTYSKDDLINGKVMVYTNKGNLLCVLNTLRIIAFID